MGVRLKLRVLSLWLGLLMRCALKGQQNLAPYIELKLCLSVFLFWRRFFYITSTASSRRGSTEHHWTRPWPVSLKRILQRSTKLICLLFQRELGEKEVPHAD